MVKERKSSDKPKQPRSKPQTKVLEPTPLDLTEITMHPLLLARLRLKTRFDLLLKGRSRDEINTATDAIDTGYVTSVAATMPNGGDVLTQAQAAGATGGGLAALIAAIEAFITSPQGQALIATLIADLIKALGG